MGTIISLHDDAHLEVQQLLPWHANNSLTESEQARVEAHLAECDECRADLETERLIGTRVASVAPDVEQGWADMQARMRAASTGRWQRWTGRRVPVAWAVGAQAAAAALIVAVLLPARAPVQPNPVYHVLGTAPVAAAGNLLVMFADGTRETDLRAALQRSGARIVDGPTVTGAYVLHVADQARAGAVARLRDDKHVTLAEPIDPGAPR